MDRRYIAKSKDAVGSRSAISGISADSPRSGKLQVRNGCPNSAEGDQRIPSGKPSASTLQTHHGSSLKEAVNTPRLFRRRTGQFSVQSSNTELPDSIRGLSGTSPRETDKHDGGMGGQIGTTNGDISRIPCASSCGYFTGIGPRHGPDCPRAKAISERASGRYEEENAGSRERRSGGRSNILQESLGQSTQSPACVRSNANKLTNSQLGHNRSRKADKREESVGDLCESSGSGTRDACWFTDIGHSKDATADLSEQFAASHIRKSAWQRNPPPSLSRLREGDGTPPSVPANRNGNRQYTRVLPGRSHLPGRTPHFTIYNGTRLSERTIDSCALPDDRQSAKQLKSIGVSIEEQAAAQSLIAVETQVLKDMEELLPIQWRALWDKNNIPTSRYEHLLSEYVKKQRSIVQHVSTTYSPAKFTICGTCRSVRQYRGRSTWTNCQCIRNAWPTTWGGHSSYRPKE